LNICNRPAYFGSSNVQLMVPDGNKIGRTPGYGQTGIDDLYAVSRPGVDYVIIEYKFGGSRPGNPNDGPQMSDSWLVGGNTGYDRIRESVNNNAQLANSVHAAVLNGRIEKWLGHIDFAGGATVQLFNSAGQVIKNPVSRVVAPPPPGN
jgi:filamentous hemagglutinin